MLFLMVFNWNKSITRLTLSYCAKNSVKSFENDFIFNIDVTLPKERHLLNVKEIGAKIKQTFSYIEQY